MHTQVAIIGAGPAGLLLSQLLHVEGISSLILERRDRTYVESRIRAGILEPITVDLLKRAGAAGRMQCEGLLHRGFKLAVDGDPFHIDLSDLTNGAQVMVYGQTELTKDLIAVILGRSGALEFDATEVMLYGLESDEPLVTYVKDGIEHRVSCDFVAGCDGYHGVTRTSIPKGMTETFERVYPFGWLGILADVPPCDEELIYSNHEHGFALASMRSMTRSRYYVQSAIDANINDWPDDRIWEELTVRLGPQAAERMVRGPSIEKSIAPLRSLVTEPMQHGRLFLAGDAAHIVPPTGAKGLNLAASDVYYLCEAFTGFYSKQDEHGLKAYSRRALARVWKAERFSWWFTGLTHRFPDTDPFGRRMQIAELEYIRQSRAAQTTLAENYVGLRVN
jgi:p-hydroxybenzoate 3-monooxygenase